MNVAEFIKIRKIESQSRYLNRRPPESSRWILLFGLVLVEILDAATQASSLLESNQHYVLARRRALRIAYPPEINTTINKTKTPILISRRPQLSSRSRSVASP